MRKHLDAVCGTCASSVSVACMSSMAAALAAAGTAAGAGATGMGAMGGMGGDTSSGTVSALPGLFEAIGLGILNRLPNEVLQPLLVVLLTLSAGSAYLAYRGHGQPHAFVLTTASAVAMYVGIYVSMSDPLYAAGLIGMLAASAWGIVLTRRPRLAAG